MNIIYRGQQKAIIATQAVDCIALVLDKEFLTLPDIGAIAGINKYLNVAVRSNSGLWEPFLTEKKLGFARAGKVEDSHWPSPNMPTDWGMDQLKIPPRPHGEQRDHNSFHPLANDIHVNERRNGGEPPLVLPRTINSGPSGMHKINPTTSMLEDKFHLASDEAGPRYGIVAHRRCIYVPRDMPIECIACGGVKLHSIADLIAHCKQFSHQNYMTLPEQRIPENFVDPREKPGFDDLPCYVKVKTLFQYKQMVVGLLRSPMSRAGKAKMREQIVWIRENVQRLGLQAGCQDEEAVLQVLTQCTVERVAEACVEHFAVSDFYNYGVSGYCLDVVLNGWENFSTHGSSSDRNLLGCVTGLDF
jgi:hypothetical protein